MLKTSLIFFAVIASLCLSVESSSLSLGFNLLDKLKLKTKIFTDNNNKVNDIWKDCGSKTGTISRVDITGCTQIPCTFDRGNNYTLAVNFVSNTNTKAVTNKVYGIIAKIPVPFHLPVEDGCQLGLNCPVKSGDSCNESVTLPVLNEYPKISLYVQWKVLDDTSNTMICFMFPVTIR